SLLTTRHSEGAEGGDDALGFGPDLDRGGPQHLSAVDHDRPLAADVVLPLLDLHVVAAGDLEHHRAPVRQPPHRVQVAGPAVAIGAPDLPVRLAQAVPSAGPAQVELAHRLRLSGELPYRVAQMLLVSHPAH